VFKLKAKQLDLKYKEEFLEFYKFICGHKTDKVREHAAFNLPCFNSTYRHFCLPPAQTKGAIARQKTGISTTNNQDEDEESKDESSSDSDFSFNQLYLQFASDACLEVRMLAASSLHEGFLAAGEDEDTHALREALFLLLNEPAP
jgi:hypothetical protein